MTLREQSMHAAVACFHLVRTGRTAPRHAAYARKLLFPVPTRTQPDLRPEDGRQIASSLTLPGMSLERAGDSLLLELNDSLLQLPQVIRDALASARHVTLRIRNGLGGDAVAAGELLQLLERKRVVVQTTYASSAHALVAVCVRGRRVIHKDGEILLHAPSCAVLGHWRHLQEASEKLRHNTETWIDRVARRCDRPKREVRGWFSADTIFDGKAALQAGLVDEIFAG